MEKSIYTKEQINDYIKQLKKHKIGFFDVPEDLRTDKSIVDIERKLGLRKATNRGYDIINDYFFVEEIITYISLGGPTTKNICTLFSDFDSYYLFLDGEIYENSCYYQFDFSELKKSIDVKKLLNKSFEKTTIDDYYLEPSAEEMENYNQAEHTHKMCKKWIKKFNVCKTYAELDKCVTNYKKSKISGLVSIQFFFFQYIFENIHDKNRFNDIMNYIYMSQGEYSLDLIIKSLCLIYNSEDVIDAYYSFMESKRTNEKQKKNLMDFVKSFNIENITLNKYCYFDPKTHFYCERLSSDQYTSICRYYENFEAFIQYRQGDLTECDISNVIGLDLDLSKYKTDSTTKLPFYLINDLTYVVKKIYKNKKYFVLQEWHDSNKNIIKNYEHKFDYFFDFVSFLKGDLSNADLLFCDGLKNLKDISKLNLTGARLTSEINEMFGFEYEKYTIDTKSIHSFIPIIRNENETALALQADREISLSREEYIKNQKIFYISDLHLLHKINNAKCKSKNDIIYLINKIVKNIIQDLSSSLLLIGGDTSSDFAIFEMFVKILRKTLDASYYKADVIFILGNHELWGFSSKELPDIINKYNLLLKKYNMYLLQNDILYKDKDNYLKTITTEELLSFDKSILRKKLRTSRIIIFGGLAFSGYNEKFNANMNMYLHTLNRQTEIEETHKFEKIYNMICETFPDKNIIIFTHTPKADWCKHQELQKHFIYVNGHTHHNSYYDDVEYRLYADNQVGYNNKNPHIKYFHIENTYDYFSDYKDGIYEITKDQYIEFYRGKNIRMTFNREVNILYMLKKNNHYCFIHKSKGGSLNILNGGALKKLAEKDVYYYYEKMDKIIAYIKKPLDPYTKFQKRISNEIKKIGGTGNIHGCIIDIDYFNHVYVNPIDMTVTGYWAQDIIYKRIYPSIPTLLMAQCPQLYNRYQDLLKSDKEILDIISSNVERDMSNLPYTYLDTDIYKASREIKKMQKLSSNILSTWYEPTNSEVMIEEKTD